MFKVGDKVICIDNSKGYENILNIGDAYEILGINIGTVTGKEHIIINIKSNIMNPLSCRFISERKLKLEKICMTSEQN